MNVRIIPRLDIKGPNLVKGVHLEGLRVLGKPEDFARYYYNAGADELFYVDSVASLYGRDSLISLIEKTSKEIFIPLTVGGGLRSTDDIKAVLRAGADKVAINTAAIKRPEFIREASRRFGSSTIVVSITSIYNPEQGRYLVYMDYGRENSGLDAVQWAVRAAELGAGELLVTSIDRDGTFKGFDIRLMQEISRSVSIPVIACGGAGSIEHIVSVIKEGNVDAVCLGSILHYQFIKDFSYSKDDFFVEGNIEFLSNLKFGQTVFGYTLFQIKEALGIMGISCRNVPSGARHA